VPEFAEQEQGRELNALLETWFTATDEQRAEIQFKDTHNGLLLQHESAIRQMIWNAYCQGRKADSFREDFDQNQVKNNSYLSPYFFKKVGDKPAQGWPLFIAMHGGGGAPQRVNDSQWNHMKIYYHDQMDGPGYLYLALRAPTNEWNGFYTEYVYPLIANLLRQFMIFEDIDANRVFLMGYSHGGYGAFAIGPIMADRFAAVHASAAAPTQGQTAPQNLRNTRFTYMIGKRDTAYKRLTFCQAFNETICQLRGERTDIYPVIMEFKQDHGHGGLPDRDKIAQMISYTRNPLPLSISWHLTVHNVPSFNWLYIPHPQKGQNLTATCQDNTVTLTTENIAQIQVLLDQRLVDMNRPVTLCINDERTITAKLAPDLLCLCETLLDRGDPEFMFSARIALDLDKESPITLGPIPAAPMPGQLDTVKGESYAAN
jgi:predicted esterase